MVSQQYRRDLDPSPTHNVESALTESMLSQRYVKNRTIVKQFSIFLTTKSFSFECESNTSFSVFDAKYIAFDYI